MGQFASRAFDGDPYIEVMRALPDKEMTWWVQKVIWTAEGLTLIDHTHRTLTQLMWHKCSHCDGAGVMTCGHCNGYKVKRAHPHAFQLTEQSKLSRLMATADLEECKYCGNYCQWDMETSWEGMWNAWQRKLTYYDRTYGALLDEWHNDVMFEGRLELDAPKEELAEPLPEDNSHDAQVVRELLKQKKRMKALMKRMGGHPYSTMTVMPKVVSPGAPLRENLVALGYNEYDLPPELHPINKPELLLEADSPLQRFDREIQHEAMIMTNLGAAIKGLPKPIRFAPTAGTTLCPECKGRAWHYDWKPNLDTLLRGAEPFWLRTLSSLPPNWWQYSSKEGEVGYSPWFAAGVGPAAEAAASVAAVAAAQQGGRARQLGWGPVGLPVGLPAFVNQLAGLEAPSIPPLLTPGQEAEAERALQPNPLPQLPQEYVEKLDASLPSGGTDWGRVFTQTVGSVPSAPSWARDFGTRLMPDNPKEISEALRELSAAASDAAEDSGRPRPQMVSEAEDGETDDPLRTLDASLQSKVALESRANESPLLAPGELANVRLRAMQLVNPLRRVARALRRGQDPDDE
ncbi:hypothetical protein V8C86DRAFT_462370 [Haematococcus lacustris]